MGATSFKKIIIATIGILSLYRVLKKMKSFRENYDRYSSVKDNKEKIE